MINEIRFENTKAKFSVEVANKSNLNSFEDPIINLKKYFKMILDLICNFESKGDSAGHHH